MYQGIGNLVRSQGMSVTCCQAIPSSQDFQAQAPWNGWWLLFHLENPVEGRVLTDFHLIMP